MVVLLFSKASQMKKQVKKAKSLFSKPQSSSKPYTKNLKVEHPSLLSLVRKRLMRHIQTESSGKREMKYLHTHT